jgi:hypothetical protein
MFFQYSVGKGGLSSAGKHNYRNLVDLLETHQEKVVGTDFD